MKSYLKRSIGLFLLFNIFGSELRGQTNILDSNISSSSYSYQNLNFNTGEIFVVFNFDSAALVESSEVANLSRFSITESSEGNLFVFPNPVRDIFEIKTNVNVISASIYSIDGKEVTKLRVDKNKVDISFVNPGVYLVVINDDRLLSAKIIKN